jgi:formylaminopyrimidine deformylase / aminopyrimidine aminohydrolase
MTITPTATGLAARLASAQADLLADLARHPFVLALADGTLADPPLIAWAQQCRLFCLQERRALMVLRSYQPAADLDGVLAQLVDDTEREPRQLAETLAELGSPVAEDLWPACLGYSSYMVMSAHQGLLPGLTAVYACERSYLDTWTAVLPKVPADARWRDWVDNWTSDGFRALVGTLGGCLDDLAGEVSPQMQTRLEQVFRDVALWELAFWEMNWRQQGWPTSGPAAADGQT